MSLAEDAKFSSSRGRNRTFYVANPSPDSDGEDRINNSVQRQSSPPPSKSSFPPLLSPSAYSQLQHAPTPLTTNLPQQYPRSNPALSSPSSLGSPGAESTPPPSTPGMLNPPVDLHADHNDLNHFVNGERTDSLLPGPTRPLPTSSLSTQTRTPQTNPTIPRASVSPTLATPDSHTSTLSQATGKQNIIVTSDSDRYSVVDITGANNPACIKERIFNKLCIFDEEEQRRYSIYRTEIGHFAIGDALSDDSLFELCREKGDAIASLKFFVSLSSAPVHESYPTPIPDVTPSPPVNTIPPPVLPYNTASQGPLRPKRRSSSRQGSLSSASEHVPPEPTGYEASVSDDFDPAYQQRPSLLRSARPPAQNLANQNFSSSPRGGRRPRSPLSTTIKNATLSRPIGDSPKLPPALPPPTMPPPPAPTPLSPSRPFHGTSDSTIIPTLVRVPHVRSGSDSVAAERDRTLGTSVTSAEQVSRAWRQKQLEEKPGPDRTREPQLPPSKPVQLREKRQGTQPNMPADDEKLARPESWVVIDRDVPIPQQSNLPPKSLSRHRQNLSSPMTVKHSGRTLEIPKHPKQAPPTPPAVSPASTRNITPPQPSGQLVPPNWVMGWKSAGKEDKRQGTNVRYPNLAKSMDKSKSMDNLRGTPIPSTLQPGRRPGNLPVSTKSGNPVVTREGIPFPNGTHNAGDNGRGYDIPGLPKSYDPARGILTGGYQPRPLPVQGSASNLDFSASPQSLVANRAPGSPNDQNLSDDARNSPGTKYGRTTHSAGLDSPYETRSPRAGSPIRSSGLGSRLNADVSFGEHLDVYGGIDVGRTPPRSPVSPPENDNLLQTKSSAPEEPRKVEKKSNNNDTEDLESTMRPENNEWFRKAIERFSETNFDATVMPSSLMSVAPKRPEISIEDAKSSWEIDPPPSTPYSEASVVEEDSDDEGTSMWKKPPQFGPPPLPQPQPQQPSSSVRPPLKVQIMAPNKNITAQTATVKALAPQPTRPAPRDPPAGKKGPRISTFSERESTWAPRPPPEDVYDRLEEFFPNHDLDKPVIEASSGGTSPTALDFPVQQLSNDKARIRNKKSIRIVAEEHKKKIDRTSRAEAGSYSNMLRKRSTKLWGSRVEEVTPGQAKVVIPPTLPESPSGGPKPIFKWVRGELIGKGTFGRVYLALNATTGEMIAVKQVEIPRTASDKNDSRQVTMVQALKLESETLKDLDHPNIVSYLGFEETTNFLSIFLEYVPGGSVGSCLQKHGKFDEEVTKSFTSQILGGLEYLHSKNILHRDLKADNILVETTGICKISDFGISKRTDDITGAGAHTAMQGTVFWMAPEVINTQPGGYNFKIDIWSVGCVVLEMWAGTRPWMGDEAVAVMFKLYQTKQPPPVPDGITLSQLADDFRRLCFAINPEDRPPASDLRKHPYLNLVPGWKFTGFS